MPNNEKPTEREMVRVLAERVMGWKLRDSTQGATLADTGDAIFAIGNHGVSMMRRWTPLESWADAGMLLEKLQMTVTPRKRDGKWEAAMHYTATTWSIADTPQRAISLAAFAWAEAQKEQR